MDDKLDRIITNYVEFKARKERKIITVTILKEELPTNEELSDRMFQKYKNIVLSNPGFSLVVDLRLLKKINISFVWKKFGSYNSKLEPIFKKNIKCFCVLINYDTIKILVDSISKVYPAIIPFGVFKDYENAIKFINSVLNKNK